MLRLEPRAVPSRFMSWFSPVLAVLLTVVCGIILFTAVGKDPWTSLGVFFLEPIKDLRGWTEVGVKVAAFAATNTCGPPHNTCVVKQE